MKYKTKIIILISLIVVILGAIVLYENNKKEIVNEVKETSEPIVENKEIVNICYFRSDKTDRGFYDKSILKLNIDGEKITGEFQHLPAESDSKIGTFEGIMGPLGQNKMARTATVWWSSQAEGMDVKEELVLEWGDGSATVGFGEMVDRGDGVYVYKDKTNLYYIKQMSQIDCTSLEEKLSTEKYVRDNIKTIATNKPVLGGTWYVTTINVNYSTKSGELNYEDGHIESKATFTYTYDTQNKKVEIIKFTITK